MRQQRYARQREMGLANTTLSDLEREVGPPYHFPEALQKLGPGEINRPLPWNELTEEQQRFQATKMAIHAAMVDRMDREIGRVIEELKAMGAFRNTLVFFASDNGASASNTPFRRHKTWVLEGGISTPLVVHWPEGIQVRGEFRHTPGHVIDIVPTILDAIGIRKPASLDGRPVPDAPVRSLLGAFAEDKAIDREFLWWLHEGNRAVRAGDWKLVASKGNPWELYDLSSDRAEARNLARDDPGRVKALEAIWQRELDAMKRLAGHAAPDDPDPAE